MKKWAFCLLIMFYSFTCKANQIEEMSAYWDGKFFHKWETNYTLADEELLEDTTIYFSVKHITCYGHALLDGILPLYSMLKEYSLLDVPINLLIETDTPVEYNTTFFNIYNLIKDVFHFKKIIVTNEQNPIKLRVKKLIVNEYVPIVGNQFKYFYFFEACPRAFEYMGKLRGMGFQDNIIFQDKEPGDNIVKDFVNFITSSYKIDLPQIKNRILISNRCCSRKILNIDELAQVLRSNGYLVAIVDFEQLSVKEQIIETIQSEYLLGTYGSNLANAVFLKPNASVLILWHKYAKYFWARKRCIIHGAFLSAGVRLVEYDKQDYDQQDIYTENIHVPEFFYRSENINILRPEKANLEEILKYPLPAMYELTNVNLYINPYEIVELLKIG